MPNKQTINGCTLYLGDCREIAPTLDYVDAIVTDSPYEISFMNQPWDKRGVSFDPSTWGAIGDCLRPGGYLLAFGGTRTQHRLACAIEDAGFVIQDCIMWLYGCLDEETQAVTQNGVKPYHKIMTGDPVLCYDLNSGEYSYQPVLEVVEYEYSDTAYRLIGDFGEQVVTRNHRCIVERDGREVFALAETLVCGTSLPILENLPDLQKALYDVYFGTGKQEQELQSALFGLDDKQSSNGKDKAAFGAQGPNHSVHCLREKGLEAECMVEENYSTNLQSAMQWGTTGGGLEETCSQGTIGLDPKIERKLSHPYDGSEQSSVERWCYISEQERELRQPVNQIYSLSDSICEYGSERRVCDGTSTLSSSNNRALSISHRSSTPSRSQCDEQQVIEFDVICNKRPTQSIRAWRGHKTSVVRVVPFHYTGKVWCLRVPTGAFVAIRNGVAFPTGNSGFPKGKYMLKPAYEPILVAYKPGGKRELQIDECRIPTSTKDKETINAKHAGMDLDTYKRVKGNSLNLSVNPMPLVKAHAHDLGRYPANLVHDGSEEVLELFP